VPVLCRVPFVQARTHTSGTPTASRSAPDHGFSRPLSNLAATSATGRGTAGRGARSHPAAVREIRFPGAWAVAIARSGRFARDSPVQGGTRQPLGRCRVSLIAILGIEPFQSLALSLPLCAIKYPNRDRNALDRKSNWLRTPMTGVHPPRPTPTGRKRGPVQNEEEPETRSPIHSGGGAMGRPDNVLCTVRRPAAASS
jgi:hypothetical protein